MATNNFFQNGRGIGRSSEQDLLESLTIEQIQMAGQDFLYIQRDQVKFDNLFNENPLAKFTVTNTLEMYVNDIQDFSGDGHLLGKFGLDMKDRVDLLVAKKRFKDEVTNDHGTPKPGDLIYWPLDGSVWNIDDVKDGTLPHMPLSSIYTFTLKCSRFVYAYEDFDTGIPAVDEINDYDTKFKKNSIIQDEADQHAISYDESNPFGEISSPADEDELEHEEGGDH